MANKYIHLIRSTNANGYATNAPRLLGDVLEGLFVVKCSCVVEVFSMPSSWLLVLNARLYKMIRLNCKFYVM